MKKILLLLSIVILISSCSNIYEEDQVLEEVIDKDMVEQIPLEEETPLELEPIINISEDLESENISGPGKNPTRDISNSSLEINRETLEGEIYLIINKSENAILEVSINDESFDTSIERTKLNEVIFNKENWFSLKHMNSNNDSFISVKIIMIRGGEENLIHGFESRKESAEIREPFDYYG